MNLKNIVENLIDHFLAAGDLSLELRKKGLIKKIKSDNTPVSNGDLEVNKLISNISGLLILSMELMITLIILKNLQSMQV